jgi:hypothetical protein
LALELSPVLTRGDMKIGVELGVLGKGKAHLSREAAERPENI